MSSIGNRIWNQISKLNPEHRRLQHVVRLTEACSFWLRVKVVEGQEIWNHFWALNNELEFSPRILDAAELVSRSLMQRYGRRAEKKARSAGFSDGSVMSSGFNATLEQMSTAFFFNSSSI